MTMQKFFMASVKSVKFAAGALCFLKSGHHDLYNFRLMCHNWHEKGFRCHRNSYGL